MKKFLPIALLTLMALGCGQQSTTIEGRIAGAGGVLLTLKKVTVGKITPLDSTRLNAAGKFSFRIKNSEPATFYQLQLDTLGNLMLLAQNGERISLTAQAQNLAESSSVSGSKEAEQMLLLQKNSATISLQFDSLMQRTDNLQEVHRRVNKLFVQQKQHNTRFIVSHPTSPASIFAYYQKFAQQTPLFGNADDRFLLRMLADSMRVHFPKSSYTKSLIAELEDMESKVRRAELQQLMSNAEVMDKPEIALPDTQGKTHRLSALKGKVVLLDFWASTNTLSLMDNRELLPIYKEYHKSGFEVFQVSLDESAEQWQASVAEQQLPWISVRCSASEGCTAAQSYVVQKLPTNFLINRKGELVGKNLYGEELRKKLKTLL